MSEARLPLPWQLQGASLLLAGVIGLIALLDPGANGPAIVAVLGAQVLLTVTGLLRHRDPRLLLPVLVTTAVLLLTAWADQQRAHRDPAAGEVAAP